MVSGFPDLHAIYSMIDHCPRCEIRYFVLMRYFVFMTSTKNQNNLASSMAYWLVCANMLFSCDEIVGQSVK